VWWSYFDTYFSTCIKFSISFNLALTFYLQAFRDNNIICDFRGKINAIARNKRKRERKSLDLKDIFISFFGVKIYLHFRNY